MFNKRRKDSNTPLETNSHIEEITAGRGKLSEDKLILVEVAKMVIGKFHCAYLTTGTISKIVPSKILVKAKDTYHIERNICLLL